MSQAAENFQPMQAFLFQAGRGDMAYYRGTPDRPEQAKAVAAVLVIHAALGAMLLSGLNVPLVREAVDRLTTIDVREPPPPPPPEPPPPARQAERSKAPEGVAGKKAEPTPVVAPKPRTELPVPPPIAAAPVAGTGSATTAGAADSGSGTGAGGQGNGRGGGGTGLGGGFTPARRISGIPNREYRGLRAISGQKRGDLAVTIRVNADGSPSDCRVPHSSGNPSLDSLMCQLTLRYLRFLPARDARGNPVAQDITWHPRWHPNR